MSYTLAEKLIVLYKTIRPLEFSESNGISALNWSSKILQELTNSKQSVEFQDENLQEKDPADYYAQQAIESAGPILENWLSTLEDHLFSGAESLEQIRDNLESVYSELDAADFASLMQNLLLAGFGAGHYQVQQETADDEEFAEDTLEYARLKLAGNTKQQKTCTKGFSCGFACISKNKACASVLPGQAKNYADWLVGQIARGGPFSPAHTKEAEKLGLGKPYEPPKEEKKTQKKAEKKAPTRKETEFAKQWGSSFDNAPNDLKKAIAKFDEPDEDILPTETAYFMRGANSINMDGFSRDDLSPTAKAVYRHEYGHHLDRMIGESKFVKAVTELAPDSNVRSIDDFNKLTSSDQLVLARKIESRLGYDAWMGVRNISNSPEGRKAIDSDNSYLTDKAIKAQNSYSKAYDDLQPKFKDDTFAKRWNNIKTPDKPSAAEKIMNGKQMLIADIDEELKEESFKARSKGKIGERDAIQEQYYHSKVQSELKGKPEVYRLVYEEKVKSKQLIRSWAPELILAARSEDPRFLADNADRLFKSAHTNDLIGSITLNTIGRGHDTNYYFRGGGDSYDMQGTEAFANLTDLHGQNTPLSKALASHLAPNTYKFMKESLRGT